jgi:hypothetical protein
VDGERAEHHGVMVRVRSASHSSGWAKARAIAVAMDTDVYQEQVLIGSSTYLVHQISRTTDVLDLGAGEAPSSKRRVYTVNAVCSIRQTG